MLNYSPSNTGSASSEPPEFKKSRMRQSFVCRNCKKRKIKCDKARPSCGRCSKLELECIYDFQENKDGRRVLPGPGTLQEQMEELEEKLEELRYTINACKRHDLSDAADHKTAVKINYFYGLQPSSLDSVYRCAYQPFSDMGMIQKHVRLKPFLNFVTQSFKPLNYAVKKILLSVGDSLDPHTDELESVAEILFLTPQVREILKKHRMNPQGITQETSDAIRRCLLEKGTRNDDTCLFEPMDLEFYASTTAQAKLIELILNVLPHRDQIETLLNYYMTVMYPLVPYLNKTSFLQVVGDTLIYSPVGVVNGLKFGSHEDFTRKIGCIATLLILLRIAHTAMTLVDDTAYDRAISNRLVLISQKCLAHLLKLSHKTNEDILSCLLLMRWSLIYSPADGDVVAGAVTDVLPSLTINHAIKIGLYRDCVEVDANFVTDPKQRYFIHYRAKLWMGCLILMRSDFYLRGTYPIVSSEYFSMEPKQDSVHNYEDELESQIHNVLHKQLRMYAKIRILDKLSLQVHEKTDVEEIYAKIRQLEYDLQSIAPLSHTQSLTGVSGQEAVRRSMNNAVYLKMSMVVKIYFLAIRASTVAILERQLKERLGDIKSIARCYREVGAEAFESGLDLCEILRDYLSTAGDLENALVMPDHRYILNQCVQVGIFRVSYYLISVTLTLLQVKNGLESYRWQNRNKHSLADELERNISILGECTKAVFQNVQKLIHQGSHSLSDRYFTSFKQFLFLDYAMQVIQNEMDPTTPSRLTEVLGDIGLPAAINYSTTDWEQVFSYVQKAFDIKGPTTPFSSSENILAIEPQLTQQPPAEDPLNSMLVLDKMLDGDYTWSDFI